MPRKIEFDSPVEVTAAARFWQTSGLLFLVLCALAVGAGIRIALVELQQDDQPDVPPKPKPPVGVTEPVVPPAERTLFKMEEAVRVGRTEWTIVEARDMGTVLKSNNMWVKDIKGNGTKFISIEGRVVNRAEKAIRIKKVLTAVSPEGKEYFETPDVGFYLPYWLERLSPRRLRPSVIETFGAIFEVPVETVELRFMAIDLHADDKEGAKMVDITPEPEAGLELAPPAKGDGQGEPGEKPPAGETEPADKPPAGETKPAPSGTGTTPEKPAEPAVPAPKGTEEKPDKAAPGGVKKTGAS
jgi:hypothetical protein